MVEFTTFPKTIKVMSPTISRALVQVQDLSLLDDNRLILDKINLTVMLGEILSIIGPNGAGKTTLLKVIVGLIAPTYGKVSRTKGLRIGYMPQRLQVDAAFPLSVERFLQLGQSQADLRSTVAEVGIEPILQTPLYAISGGELQRVLLARALLRKPELLVLDEPVQGVDLIGQGELYNLIGEIRDRHGCAILLVSHDLNVVMAKTDKVFCLNQHVCCSGHPEKVSKDPAFTALFGPISPNFAFYTHRHDHHHDGGKIITSDKDHDHE